MVYINGDNNLEEDALIDFLEMARVGSTDEVNVVVQLDRIGKYVSKTDERFPYWTETLRFRVTKGMKPSREKCAQRSKLCEANMGAGKTLADFVAWTKTHLSGQTICTDSLGPRPGLARRTLPNG